jgi:hypothetical protein
VALTMTRTRTQTTLTRLAKLLAILNGELEFVEWLLGELPDHREALTARRESLVANRDAVVATLRQFDPGLAVHAVGSTRLKKTRRAVERYVKALQNT